MKEHYQIMEKITKNEIVGIRLISGKKRIIKSLCKRFNLSISEVVRTMIQDYFEKHLDEIKAAELEELNQEEK